MVVQVQEENKDGNQVKGTTTRNLFQQVMSHFRRIECMLKVIIFKVFLVHIS